MVRTWWSVLALAAIFAMHGLASHATAAEPDPVALPSVTAVTHTPDHTPLAAASGDAGSTLDDQGHDGGHHAMQVMGLCVAVLATAAIALLRLARPTRGVLAVLPRAVRTATTPPAAGNAHAPPDLHALSVLRC